MRLRHQQRQRDRQQHLPEQALGQEAAHQAVSAIGRDAADVGGEAVAAAPHGLDQLRIAAVDFHLAPQAADLVVDRAVEQVRLAALHHVEQAVAVEHLARMGQEGDEQAELGRGERHHGAFGIGQPALERIELPALEFVERVLVGRRRRLLGRAAQHRADARDQLARLERLDHVVVGADLEPDDAVGRLAPGGEQDHRDVLALRTGGGTATARPRPAS